MPAASFLALVTLGNANAELEAFVQAKLAEFQVPGAAVAVVQDGRVVLAKGFGVRRYGDPKLVDENTRFQMASVTKTFTAVAAGIAVQEGKVGWDQPVAEILPEFQHYDIYTTRYLTLRDLLAHRGVFPAFSGDLLDDLGYTRAEIVHRLRFVPPATSFRNKSAYSNLGFFLAGETAARATGLDWNSLVEQRILRPLGMSRSATSYKSVESDPNRVGQHAVRDGRLVFINPSRQDTMGAAGAVVSTAKDMGQFIAMLANQGSRPDGEILKPQTVKEMFKPSMATDIDFTELPPISETTGLDYGFGVTSYSFGGLRIIEKGGALAGVRTVIVMVPERRAAIAVMANLNFTAFPEAVRAFWLDRLVGQDPAAHQAAIVEVNKTLMGMLKSPPPAADPGRPPHPVSAIVGRYLSPLYGNFTVRSRGGQLIVVAGPGNYTGDLTHFSQGVYRLQWPNGISLPSDVTFDIGADGKAQSMTWDDLGVMKRLPDPASGE